MARTYLVRGLLAGLIASIVAFGVARTIGEPQVAKAVQFEEQQAQQRGESPEPEVVSRAVQDTVGLGTGLLAAGVAVGGLFALAFAVVYQRAITARACVTAVLLAGSAFVSVFLIPFLKYPANPPAVGNPDTIGRRTTLYLLMILVSLLALVVAALVRRRLAADLGTWNATLVAVGCYIAVVVAAWVVMPGVNEVPEGFPTIVLWRFRLASVAIQGALWATIGLTFGAMIERCERQARARHVGFATVE